MILGSRLVDISLNSLPHGLDLVFRRFAVRYLSYRKSAPESHRGFDDTWHRKIWAVVPCFAERLMRTWLLYRQQEVCQILPRGPYYRCHPIAGQLWKKLSLAQRC